MNAQYFACLSLAVAAVALTACVSPPPPKPVEPLAPIETTLRYVTPSDIGRVALRAAVIDISRRGARTVYALSVGTLHPYDGLFYAEEAFADLASLNALIAAFIRYADATPSEMPVGLVLTCEGECPGIAGAQPEPYFTAAVGALEKTLAEYGIRYAFVIPSTWEAFPPPQ